MRTSNPAGVGCLLPLLLLLGGCASTPAPVSREPANLSDAKAAVIAYHESGDYVRDLSEAMRPALEWIERRAKDVKPGERLAVVFDIDETVLSNVPHMFEQDFGYIREDWIAWVERGEAPVIEPVREVYAAARRNGVSVLFLSGRSELDERSGTERNLLRAGMGDYAELRLLQPHESGMTARERKQLARERWVMQGWTLIANVGDQDSDLGPPAEKSFKLPNPFYRIE